MVIKFDDGEHITAEERGGGWIKDEDGDLHRMRKLGFETVLEKEKEGCLVCDECGSIFDTKKGLKSHQTIAGLQISRFDEHYRTGETTKDKTDFSFSTGGNGT